MTVIVAGKGEFGSLLVSDAIVKITEDISTFKDCRLENKIKRLNSSNSFCTILGDENVLNGIDYLDDWYYQKGLNIDFKSSAHLEEALVVSKKFVEMSELLNHNQPSTSGATIYFIDDEKLYTYEIKRIDGMYSIESFRLFNENELIINYGGYVENLPMYDLETDNYFKETCDIINNFHNRRKNESIDKRSRLHLEYDFDDRFCGALFLGKNGGKIEILSPFRTLSEYLASSTGEPETTWKLIDNEDFKWSPNLENISKKNMCKNDKWKDFNRRKELLPVKWSTNEALLQSYRDIFITTQSIFIGIGLVSINDPVMLPVIGFISIITIWFIWYRVVISRHLAVDYYKYSLELTDDALKELFEKCKNPTDYISDSKKRIAANDLFGIKDSWRLTRIKIDIIIPVLFTAIWVTIYISPTIKCIIALIKYFS